MEAFIIILTGSLVAICCSLLGSFLILRKMSMVGDAISHAVLPGIVLAYFAVESSDSIWLIIGAGLLGIFTTFLIEFFHHRGKLQTDASIGVTFTALFAFGVILVTFYAGNSHIDQDCILHGEIAYTPIDLVYTSAGTPIAPKAILSLTVVFILVAIFLGLFYKEMFITTFDPQYSGSIGIHSARWHYALMGLVSLTTVAAFESVGAILVVAFLIVPAASAYLLTNNLRTMLLLSCLFGIISSAIGYLIASNINGSIAGAMVSVSGFIFLGCYLITTLKR